MGFSAYEEDVEAVKTACQKARGIGKTEKTYLDVDCYRASLRDPRLKRPRRAALLSYKPLSPEGIPKLSCRVCTRLGVRAIGREGALALGNQHAQDRRICWHHC